MRGTPAELRTTAPEPDAHAPDVDDVVLFDVTREAASLRARLLEERPAWVQVRDGRRFVAASVRPEPSDLAWLLRTVQAWLTERRFVKMRFELDGHAYSLRLRDRP